MGQHAVRRPSKTLSAIVTGTLVASVVGLVTVHGAVSAKTLVLSENLVQNSGFEDGTSGWATRGSSALKTLRWPLESAIGEVRLRRAKRRLRLV